MSLDFRLKPEATPSRHHLRQGYGGQGGLSIICQSALSPAADRFEIDGIW